MRGFTTTNSQIVNVLQNNVQISQSSIISNKENKENIIKCNFVATWDTGATNTMISENVVKICNLVSTGITQVGTAGGIVPANTYVIDLLLPDNMLIKNLNVTCGKLNGTDVLVGMDIINTGDFSVSNFKGKTKFTFRMPSLGNADYVQEAKDSKTVYSENKPLRNSKCPCGSGKKYKQCCGKNG